MNARAQPIDADISRATRKIGERRTAFTRIAVANLLSRIDKRSPAECFVERYGAEQVRAVAGPATQTTPGWASELAPAILTDFLLGGQSPALLPQLIDLSVAVRLGVADVLRVPYRTTGASGAWVAEGAPIPVIAAPLGSFLMTGRKCASISVFSNELERGSTIETIVARVMRADLAKVVDGSLTDDQPATAELPAGLRNGVAATPAGTDLQATMTALMAAILAAGATAPAFLVNPLEALALAFAPGTMTIPVLSSTNVPPGIVIALDLDSFVGSLGSVRLETSAGATLVMSDPAVPISSGGAANPVRSTFQTDSTAVKCVFAATWGVAPGRLAWAELA